jgi:DNA-binding transcriptional ArsR family regulator
VPRLTPTPRALAALGSPARQELVAALGEGPATVRDLGQRLGRSRQALYHHLALLERARLVRIAGWRGTGRSRERRYALVSRRLAFGGPRASRSEREHAVKAAEAMLRLTGRELARALHATSEPSSGPARALIAARAKLRLDRQGLRRLNALIDELVAYTASADVPSESGRHYVLTLVLAPAGTSRVARERRTR